MGRHETSKRERRGRRNVRIHNRGIRRNWITGVIVAAGITAGIAAWHWAGALWDFKKAPSFTLQASTGQAVSLEDYRRNKEVVLIFYMGAG